MKILNYHLPHPTHYHQFYLNKIAEKSNINLKVIYYENLLSSYPWKSKFNTTLHTKTLNKIYFNIDFKYILKKKKGIHFVAGWIEPTMIILLTYWAITNKPYIIGTDTIRDRNKNNILEKIRSIWLYSLILKNAKAIVTTGEIGVNKIKKLPIGKVNVFNYPYVTDLEVFKPNYNNKNNIFTFLSSGRLDINHKGFDISIKALALIKSTFPNFNFIYNIIGHGSDYDILNKLIIDQNLSENVKLLGWKETIELPHYYQTCDIFLHPSNFDPFPNAVLEAMASGNIVIASDSAGSAIDRIKHSQNGFIFKTKNVMELFSIISGIIVMNDIEKNKIQLAARDTAEKWTYNYNIQILEKIFDL
jgi:glycosyltransferase involved in cell wall biosynthesis